MDLKNRITVRNAPPEAMDELSIKRLYHSWPDLRTTLDAVKRAHLNLVDVMELLNVMVVRAADYISFTGGASGEIEELKKRRDLLFEKLAAAGIDRRG